MSKDQLINYVPATIDDLSDITAFFKDTILTVNKSDYSTNELEAWSKGADITDNWKKRISDHYFTLAKCGQALVGMASINDTGYLDLMYVHHQYQGQKIATTLLQKMEKRALDLGHEYITSDVSITARPFFMSRGYSLVRPQLVLCRGVVLRNYNIEKKLRQHLIDHS